MCWLNISKYYEFRKQVRGHVLALTGHRVRHMSVRAVAGSSNMWVCLFYSEDGIEGIFVMCHILICQHINVHTLTPI